ALTTTGGEEPIAIVGMSCRLPGGVTNPEMLWSLLSDGRVGLSPFPVDRGWDPSFTGSGGFIADAAGFDAGFFGISQRGGLASDPQRRQIVGCSWEAFEHAGIDPLSLIGSDSGVFVGVGPQDYGPRLHEAADAEGHLLTGSAGSVVSGRVSYALGLQG